MEFKKNNHVGKFMKKISLLLLTILMASLLFACVPVGGQGGPNAAYTQAAGTIGVTQTYVSVQSTILAGLTATQAQSTATPAVPTATETPAVTDTPTLTATLAATPTPLTAMISANQNTNCRVYPSGYAKYQSALMTGQKVAVRGRLSNNSWYLIEDPEASTQSCWVWDNTTTVEGDASTIPVIAVELTPYPSYSISGSVSPNDYSGPCPVVVTVYGKIKASMGSDDDISYGWTTNFGVDPGSGTAEFDDAGSQTFSQGFYINSDTSGWVKFWMYEPESKSTSKMSINIDCN